MKKIIVLLLCFSTQKLHVIAQNVGVGTTTPADKFTVKTLSGAFGVSHTDGTVTISTYISSGIGWFGTKSNHPLSFYTNNSLQQLTLNTNGNFGIGTALPDYRLNVTSNIIAGNTNTNLLKLSGQNPVLTFSNGTTDFGYLKAWTYQPYAPFTNGLVIGSSPGYPIFFSTNNYSASMEVADNGNVGIGVTSPVNKLQVGAMSGGYSGNDIAFGNGTNATGLFQSDSYLQVASTTNMVLLPGQGRVGINTATPRAPLDVVNEVSVSNLNRTTTYAYFTLGTNNNFNPVDVEGGVSDNIIPNVSIIASNRIVATEFDAYSDARIKNIIGRSSMSTDLEMINRISITDYTMKDKVVYGNSLFKKVIAQDVEKVYPQIISKHKDFIPNVYQVTTKIEKTTTGYLFTFADKHNINSNAKKLRMLLQEGKSMEVFDIVSIPSENKVIVKLSDRKYDKVFVYGEEVDDFRTVDYEGLTTLNISATQELSRQIKKQQEVIEMLEKRLFSLESKNKVDSTPVSSRY